MLNIELALQKAHTLDTSFGKTRKKYASTVNSAEAFCRKKKCVSPSTWKNGRKKTRQFNRIHNQFWTLGLRLPIKLKKTKLANCKIRHDFQNGAYALNTRDNAFQKKFKTKVTKYG